MTYINKANAHKIFCSLPKLCVPLPWLLFMSFIYCKQLTCLIILKLDAFIKKIIPVKLLPKIFIDRQ